MILDPKRSEPWFNERLTSITGENVWCKQDEIIYNQINRQNAKLILRFEFISENSIVGDYHEFGCHRCRTFRMALLESSRHFLENKMRFFAYDSFKGLPKVETDHKFGSKWNEGSLFTSKEEFIKLITESGFKVDNIQLVEGFIMKLYLLLIRRNYILARKPLINIDCDLYSPLFVFNHINHYSEGTILYIDDCFTGYKS